MSESSYLSLAKSLETLKINLLLEEFAAFAMEQGFTEKEISAIDKTFAFLARRKEQMTVDMMLRLSRLPRKNPKTFDNFRFDDVRGVSVRVSQPQRVQLKQPFVVHQENQNKEVITF